MHEVWMIPYTAWRHFCFVIAGNGRSKSHQRGDENIIVWQWEFWGWFFMDAYLQKTYINVLYCLNVAFFNTHVLRVLRVSWMYHFSFFMLMICLRVVVGFECSESFESWWVCAILWIIFNFHVTDMFEGCSGFREFWELVSLCYICWLCHLWRVWDFDSSFCEDHANLFLWKQNM